MAEERYTVTIVKRYQREPTVKIGQTEKQALWWEKEFETNEEVLSVHVVREK